ncbi:MAG: hypothetical protein OZ921_00910 [Sorangiineae bacterium]|nr:hypothetical protein [Polyangiaceae bacterium]MEB2321043.1 hypothetical protein [Sorangiineae bacterium]
MSNVDQQIRERIESFVRELNALVRRAAIDAVARALDGKPEEPARPAAARAPRAPRAAKSAGGKRTPAQIDATAKRILKHVAEHPGQSVESMSKQLGVITRELALPIKKLVKSGELRTEGQRRATKYFPGGGAAAGAAPKARRAAKAARGAKRARRARPAKRG